MKVDKPQGKEFSKKITTCFQIKISNRYDPLKNVDDKISDDDVSFQVYVCKGSNSVNYDSNTKKESVSKNEIGVRMYGKNKHISLFQRYSLLLLYTMVLLFEGRLLYSTQKNDILNTITTCNCLESIIFSRVQCQNVFNDYETGPCLQLVNISRFTNVICDEFAIKPVFLFDFYSDLKLLFPFYTKVSGFYVTGFTNIYSESKNMSKEVFDIFLSLLMNILYFFRSRKK